MNLLDIYHFNGVRLKKLDGGRLIKYLLSMQKKDETRVDWTHALQIILISTEKDLELTEISLRNLNLPYYKHIVPADGWRNSDKSQHLHHLLTTSARHKPYTLFLDAADVIVMNNLNHLFSSFLDSQYKAWINTEFVFWPEKRITLPDKTVVHTQQFKDFQESKATKYFSVRNLSTKYLNSGVILAETPFLKSILDEILLLIELNPTNKSDQCYFHYVYQQHHSQIWLDTQCQFMQSFGGDGFVCRDELEWGTDLVKNLVAPS